MTKQWWHQRGCPLIGTTEPTTMRLTDGVLTWDCCGGRVEGQESDDREEPIQVGEPTRVRLPALVDNVEHPAARLAEQSEQAAKLEGWVTAAMRIDHPETRTSVLDSLAAHIARTGQVP